MIIVFEGLHGSGKTSQIKLLKKWFEKEKKKVFYSNWNSFPLLQELNQKLKFSEELSPYSSLLIHTLDLNLRYEKILNEYDPSKDIIIFDRYIYTSLIREGLRNISKEKIKIFNETFPEPDLTFFIDISPEKSRKRMRLNLEKRSPYIIGKDLNYSNELEENFNIYLNRQRKEYLNLFRERNENTYIINGENDIDCNHKYIKSIVQNELKKIILNVEKEIKIKLTKEQFSLIKKNIRIKCNNSRKINQINYYIDSNDFELKRNKITIKLREYIGKKGLELTLKYNLKEIEKFSLKQKNEVINWINFSINDIIGNSKVKKQLFQQIKLNLKEFANYDVKNEIRIMGKLMTERELYAIPGLEKNVILDKSFYLNEIDYELELESDNYKSDFEKLRKYLEKCGDISMSFNKSKSSRFFDKYKNIDCY